jgi:predicted dehydrogenase
MYAIERGIHVLVTKPATQLLSHHNALIAAAREHNVVCFVEHHKRWAFRVNGKLKIIDSTLVMILCTAMPNPEHLRLANLIFSLLG